MYSKEQMTRPAKILRLLNDRMLVRVEPSKKTTPAGIIKPGAAPVWIGEVLMAGPGRHYKDKYVPMEDDIIGKRVAFLSAATDSHEEGLLLKDHLAKDERIIRQSDILLVVEGEVDITKEGPGF